MNKALIFVESNTSGTGALFVRAARGLSLRPVLVTTQPSRYTFLNGEAAPEVIVVSTMTEDALYDVLRSAFDDGRDIAGITSSSECFIAIAAALAARFGLPGPDAGRVRAARNKAYQRQALETAGLPTPRFRVVTTAEEAVRAAREVGLPVVVKPVAGSGSVGVLACATTHAVRRHADSLIAGAQSSETPSLLVESFVDGPEFSVEVFSGRILGITSKHVGPLPNFVETGHDYPAVVPDDVARELTDVVMRATALLGLDWGPLHWELRMRDGRAFAMEVNPRLAGGFIPELIRYAQGIDPISDTLRLVIGVGQALEPRRHRYASIRFLLAPRPGRLTAISRLVEARALDGVVDVALYRNVGERVALHGDFRDRIGHVIACADDPETAASSAVRGQDTVRIEIENVEVDGDVNVSPSRTARFAERA